MLWMKSHKEKRERSGHWTFGRSTVWDMVRRGRISNGLRDAMKKGIQESQEVEEVEDFTIDCSSVEVADDLYFPREDNRNNYTLTEEPSNYILWNSHLESSYIMSLAMFKLVFKYWLFYSSKELCSGVHHSFHVRDMTAEVREVEYFGHVITWPVSVRAKTWPWVVWF